MNKKKLYLIEILHQTTTLPLLIFPLLSCILSKFYIKPQRENRYNDPRNGCILSKFYIKPQLRRWCERYNVVVSYRNSTSNHNSRAAGTISAGVVSYRNSTSNHNASRSTGSSLTVVSYRNSTSNHNLISHMDTQSSLYLIEILHQTTTSGLILIDKVLLTGCLPL